MPTVVGRIVLDGGDLGGLRLALTETELVMARVCLGNANEFVYAWRRGAMFGWERAEAGVIRRRLRDDNVTRVGIDDPDSELLDGEGVHPNLVLTVREARLIADAHFAVLIALRPRELQTILGYEPDEVRSAGNAWVEMLRSAGYE